MLHFDFVDKSAFVSIWANITSPPLPSQMPEPLAVIKMLQSFTIIVLGTFLLIGCSNSSSTLKAKDVESDTVSVNNNLAKGKMIFYNHCTNCHNPINKYPEPSPPTSQTTLYEMYEEKITADKLQTSLLQNQYHSHLKDLTNNDSINVIIDFIKEAYSPRY